MIFSIDRENVEGIVITFLHEEYEFLKDFKNTCNLVDKKDIKKDMKAIKRVHNYMTLPEDHIS